MVLEAIYVRLIFDSPLLNHIIMSVLAVPAQDGLPEEVAECWVAVKAACRQGMKGCVLLCWQPAGRREMAYSPGAGKMQGCSWQVNVDSPELLTSGSVGEYL